MIVLYLSSEFREKSHTETYIKLQPRLHVVLTQPRNLQTNCYNDGAICVLWDYYVIIAVCGAE